MSRWGNHPPCPGGCNELADECRCARPNPLGSMKITRAKEAACVLCSKPADHVTETCCSSHNKVLCHACYRRTHFVEVCPCALCEYSGMTV